VFILRQLILDIDYLKDTAKFIVEHFSGVFCVNFVAMEMMGNAAKNREILWVNNEEVFKKAKVAIEILVTSGIDVQLYNFPLCAVEHDYWRLAAKSITEYKMQANNGARLDTHQKNLSSFINGH